MRSALTRPVLIAFGLAIAAALVWLLSRVLLLAVAAVLLALAARALGGWLNRHARLPEIAAAPVAMLLIVGLVLATLTLFGAQLAGQLGEVAERLPELLGAVERQLGLPFSILSMASDGFVFARPVAVRPDRGGSASPWRARWSDVATVVAAAVFLALNPRLHLAEFAAFAPAGWRGELRALLRAIGEAWSRWMLAQAAVMLVVGSAVAMGAAAIGLPSPLALGLIAGLFEIVPIVGSIVGGAIPVLFAVPMGLETTLWTLAPGGRRAAA